MNRAPSGGWRLRADTAIVAPVRARGQCWRALTLVTNTPGRSLTDDDLPLVEDLAHRGGSRSTTRVSTGRKRFWRYWQARTRGRGHPPREPPRVSASGGAG
jgi:hypothetical protein